MIANDKEKIDKLLISKKSQWVRSSFTRKQVAITLGITANKATHYTELGIIRPGIREPEKGSERNRLYSRRNLVEVALIQEMIKCGIKLDAARSILDAINFCCSEAPPEVAPGSLGFDALDPDDSITAKRFLFLIVYDDQDELKMRIEVRYFEAGADMEKFEISTKGLKNAKIINLNPLLDYVRRRLAMFEHDQKCRVIDHSFGKEIALEYHLKNK